MKLSIIIVSFNTRDILKKCLRSLKVGCRGLRGDWEVIVVDNASTDSSVELLKILGIKTIFNDRNLGFAKAVNQGIRKAGGEYILFLNSDIICKKGAIAKLVEFARSRKDLGVVGGRLLDPDGTGQASAFRFPTILGAIREFFLGQKDSFGKYLPSGKRLVAVEAVSGAVMLIPRVTIEKIGLLDERYFMYFEDLDYCRRVKKAGLKTYYLPEAQFFHFHGQSGKKTPKKVSSYLVDSSKIYHGAAKYYLLTLVLWLGQKLQKFKK